MIALVQRVREARVQVEGRTVGEIGRGLLVLVGIHHTDTPAEGAWLARKVAGLRIFADAEGRMNLSVVDVGGDVLVVSQFTLYGDASRGNRPSYSTAAPPEQAERLYLDFTHQVARHIGKSVPTGVFGADMQVTLVNDGPVTLWIEKRADARADGAGEK